MSSEDGSTGQGTGQQTGQGQPQGQPSHGQPGGQQGQPGGQPGQPGGQPGQPGQPGGQQYGGQPPAGGSGNPTDVLTRPDGQAVIKYVVGLYTLVGVGIGLTGLLAANQFSGGSSLTNIIGMLIGVGAITVAMFSGPIVAAIVGLHGTLDVGQDATETYVLGFVSTAVGYILLVVLTLFLTSLGMGGGGSSAASSGGLDVGSYIVPAIMMAIPTGIVAVGVTWLQDWTDAATV